MAQYAVFISAHLSLDRGPNSICRSPLTNMVSNIRPSQILRKAWCQSNSRTLCEITSGFDFWQCTKVTSYKNTRTLQWRHDGHDGVSNHQPHDCLLSRLFRSRSKKTSELRVTGLYVGNSQVTGEFPAQMASNAENFSIWWRHHVTSRYTLLAKKVVTPRDDVSFLWLFLFHQSARSKDRLFGVI